MCGICGILFSDTSRKVDPNILQSMTDILSHRGPDDEGIFTADNIGLGHRRLSIIDLSRDAKQPMTNSHHKHWIVFNGEIYNYLELRQTLIGKGYRFQTHSDTEVLLTLYEEYGEECVHYLNGMFAFAIWDAVENKLFAARDHFGIKPFYYFNSAESFVFGSEIKAIFQSKQVESEADYNGLTDYFTFQFCLGDKTLFRNIKKLLPGHFLTYSPNQNLRIEKYWDLDYSLDTQHREEYFESKLLRLLEDSIRLQLRADVPVGAHLSGGLDSSTVTALASTLVDSDFHTFSGGFKESEKYDETAFARIVSDTHHTSHHEIFPEDTDFVDKLSQLVYHMDEPAAGPGIFPQYFVSSLASQNVKVVLGGQGGDELFGGYTRYLVAYLEECIKGGIEGTQPSDKYVVTFESILPNLTQLQGYEPMLKYFWSKGVFEEQSKRYFRLLDRSTSIRHLLNASIWQNRDYSVFEEFDDIFNSGNCYSYINKMTHFDQKTLLPALLQVEDRTSMAVSLESRVPLLDYRIAELLAGTPPMIKYKGGRSKYLFRKVVEHIVPQEIYNRTDKMGFPVPLTEWYQAGPVREFICEILLGNITKQRGLFDTRAIEPALTEERAFGRGIWGLLNIELWFRTFID